MTSWYTPTAVLPHSPKFPHSSLDHFLFWVPRCPAPSTWESLRVKIDRGGEARVPYKAGPGQQLPMCPSQLSKVLPQHEVSIWPESQVTCGEREPRAPLLPDLVAFSADSGPLG